MLRRGSPWIVYLQVEVIKTTLGFGIVWSLLIGIWQMLRMAHSLSHSWVFEGRLLGHLLVLILPAVLTLALPLGFFLALALILGTRAQSHELLAYFSLGYDVRSLFKALRPLVLVCMVIEFLLVAYFSPHALSKARDLLDLHLKVGMLRVLNGSKIVHPTKNLWISGQSTGDLSVEYGIVLWHAQSHWIYFRAEQMKLKWNPNGLGPSMATADLYAEQLKIGSSQWQVEAKSLEIPKLLESYGQNPWIPNLEMKNFGTLYWDAKRNPRALGQLAKRITLVGAIYPLSFMLITLIFQTFQKKIFGLWMALAFALGLLLFALARTMEIGFIALGNS